MYSKDLFISQFKPGLSIQEAFLTVEARKAETRSGLPYWDLTLQDASGRVAAKVWSPLSQQIAELKPGELVFVQAKVEVFRDRLQLNIGELEVLDPGLAGLDWSSLIPQSTEDPESILADIEAMCRKELRHRPWLELCRSVLRDPEIRPRLLQAPGAKTVHHAYRGGLLEHTRQVCRVCLVLADLYPELDREFLFVAALFHDLGKAWEIEGLVTWEQSDPGHLLGHIQLGLERLEPFLDQAKGLDPGLVLHLKHAIISHHGELEFGSAKRPKTPEAFALHFADDLDAKMMITTTALAGLTDPGENWTAKLWTLQRRLFNRKKTPAPAAGQKDKEAQCSLPLKG
jgi:3'-5' exoribonuclease